MKITSNMSMLSPAAMRKRLNQLHNDVGTTTLQQAPAATVKVSALAKHYGKTLALLDEQEKIRPEAVERGRQAMMNWKDLSREQLDRIAESILQEA